MSRKAYMAAYYQANKPTQAERALMAEANREKRKEQNARYRANAKLKQAAA
ncbi:MAG: hypothetical protein WC714_28490 [Candidatus Obscuribacterales bacterium]